MTWLSQSEGRLTDIRACRGDMIATVATALSKSRR